MRTPCTLPLSMCCAFTNAHCTGCNTLFNGKHLWYRPERPGQGNAEWYCQTCHERRQNQDWHCAFCNEAFHISIHVKTRAARRDGPTGGPFVPLCEPCANERVFETIAWMRYVAESGLYARPAEISESEAREANAAALVAQLDPATWALMTADVLAEAKKAFEPDD